MDLKTTRQFDKKFAKLDRETKFLVLDTLDLLRENPNHPALRNHELSGSMSGKRSISAGEDMRIIFVEKGNYIQVLVLDVGGHSEVYFD